MIPAWLPVAVPWTGAVLLAVLPRRRAGAGVAVAVLSFAAALALAADGGGARPRPDAFASMLLLCGAVLALLAIAAEAGAASDLPDGRGRAFAAGFPVLQGAHAAAVLATDAALAWAGLAVAAVAGTVLVAVSGGRRAAAAAWKMLLLCGAGLASALLGVALLREGAANAQGLGSVGFVLLLFGYGALAGLAPFGVWLPRAMAAGRPAVAVLLVGLLPPAALRAVLQASAASGSVAGALPPGPLLAGAGVLTLLVAAVAATRAGAIRVLPGWNAVGLGGLAAVAFGLGGQAGVSAGVLLLLGAPFCAGAAVLGAAGGGPVAAALGRAALAGMPPFAPFVALVLLLSAVAALPPATALPLGAALLAGTAAQLGTAGRRTIGDGEVPARMAGGWRGWLLIGPPWLLLGLALLLGAALPEPVAAVLAEAAESLR